MDQSLLIPAAAPGDWFILVYGEAVPEPAGFTLLARTATVIVNSVSPNRMPSAVSVEPCDTVNAVELVIEGTGFRDVTSVELVTNIRDVTPGGEVVERVGAVGELIEVESSQRLRAKVIPRGLGPFNFLRFAPDYRGPLSVRVTNQDGSVGLLDNAIESVGPIDLDDGDALCNLVSPASVFLRTNLVLPSVITPAGVATLFLEYENTGVLPITSPILLLRMDAPEIPDLKPIMTLDPSIVPTGFLTSANSDGFSDTIQVLASGRIPGVLAPGERMEVLWGPTIAGRRLLLTETVSGQSVLLGSVKRAAGGDGVTTLESVVGTSGVENRLTNPPFVMRNIAAEIVDSLLETDALATLREFH